MSERILLIINEAYPWFFPVCLAVLGGVFGSFLTCMSYRLPRGLNPSQPPSYCPSCQTPLGVVDLVPVLSWCWLRGKCRHCGAPYGGRYVLIELAAIVLALTLWGVFGLHWHLLPAFVAGYLAFYGVLARLQGGRWPWRVLLFSLILWGLLAAL